MCMKLSFDLVPNHKEMKSFLLVWLWTAAARPFSNQRSFGHSIKNGALPAHSEVTTFQHTCGTPPCVITQLSVPSIYPQGSDKWNWTEGVVSFYVDGEAQPSIAVTLLELAGEGHWNKAGDNRQGGDSMPDGSPWGIPLMGRTAKSGAVYSTMRVPFGKTIRTTIKPPPSATKASIFWFVIRGLEAHGVRLGDLELPDSARLRLHRSSPTIVPKLKLLTLADVPKGVSGVLARVHLDARSSSFEFLEACMRFFPDGRTDDEPLFLSSGAEDYFLGASYFDEGIFKTTESGLTYFNRSTFTIAAYKTHDRDNVVWSDGMRLVFRACEDISGCGDINHCPNRFCNEAQLAYALASTVSTTIEYDQYFLGEKGATCTKACEARGLFCNATMDLWDHDQGAKMMQHLGVADCLRNGTAGGKPMGLRWWAPDQPNYVSDASDENYRHCVGWAGYPQESQCDASFPAAQRVCHCTETAPRPPPAPIPSGAAEYSVLVWTYEWPREAEVAKKIGDAAGPALRLVQSLAGRGLLSQRDEDAATDLILASNVGALRLLDAFTADLDEGTATRVARQLQRYISNVAYV